jgi:hypothetical protein
MRNEINTVAAREEATAVATVATNGELQHLRAEIARLREDNDDLRASILFWIRLYEVALSGVNEDGGTTI